MIDYQFYWLSIVEQIVFYNIFLLSSPSHFLIIDSYDISAVNRIGRSDGPLNGQCEMIYHRN